MSEADKILVIPRGPVFFEGEPRKLPKEGALVSPSSYYFRLVRDGSLEIAKAKKQASKAETKQE